jgi:hypothetical protein
MTTAEIFMVILTGVVALTGVLGVIIFNGQLTAMQQATQDSREAFITSNRAFVFLSKFDLIPVVAADHTSVVAWEINPVFENTGGTPTVNLMIKINSQLVATDPPTDEFPPDYEDEPINIGTVIRPRATATVRGPTIPVEHIDMIAAKSQKFFIWGWAEYKDIFKGTSCHRIRFLNTMVPSGNYRARPGSEGMPLRLILVGRFNEPDDNCTHIAP